MIFYDFEKKIAEKINAILGEKDPAHDFNHVHRVVNNALKISQNTSADLNIVLPAAYLHDFVNLSKDSPDRKFASTLSADAAIKFLKEINYPEEFMSAIHHAICAHSFSAKIEPKTIEAKIVQDADRLDGLGSIGIYRLFTISMQLNRNLNSALEHVEEKLRVVSQTMQTDLGKKEAKVRMDFIEAYIAQLNSEISFSREEI